MYIVVPVPANNNNSNNVLGAISAFTNLKIVISRLPYVGKQEMVKSMHGNNIQTS